MQQRSPYGRSSVSPQRSGPPQWAALALVWSMAFVALPTALLHAQGRMQDAAGRTVMPAETTRGAAPAEPMEEVGEPATQSGATTDDVQGSRIERIRAERLARAAADADTDAYAALTGKPDALIGVFLTGGSMGRKDGFYERTMESVGAAGGNAIVMDVKGSGVFFDSAAPLATELGHVYDKYGLQETIAEAHRRGFSVIGRFVAVKDYALSGSLPETMITHPRTGVRLSPGWIDPSHPTALQYNREILCELAAAGIDEINLDYIRFSTAFVGSLRTFSGQEKADRVLAFVKMARETIDACGPATRLGISTYAILGWKYDTNVETLGQDVVRFAPYVDIISPMAYPATFAQNAYYIPGVHPRSRMYYLVYRTMTGYRELLGDDAWKLRPWIQGYGVSVKNVLDQMDAVADSGSCGFQFWNASNVYGPVLGALRQWERPAGCVGR